MTGTSRYNPNIHFFSLSAANDGSMNIDVLNRQGHPDRANRRGKALAIVSGIYAHAKTNGLFHSDCRIDSVAKDILSGFEKKMGRIRLFFDKLISILPFISTERKTIHNMVHEISLLTIRNTPAEDPKITKPDGSTTPRNPISPKSAPTLSKHSGTPDVSEEERPIFVSRLTDEGVLFTPQKVQPGIAERAKAIAELQASAEKRAIAGLTTSALQMDEAEQAFNAEIIATKKKAEEEKEKKAAEDLKSEIKNFSNRAQRPKKRLPTPEKRPGIHPNPEVNAPLETRKPRPPVPTPVITPEKKDPSCVRDWANKHFAPHGFKIKTYNDAPWKNGSALCILADLFVTTEQKVYKKHFSSAGSTSTPDAAFRDALAILDKQGIKRVNSNFLNNERELRTYVKQIQEKINKKIET